MTCVRLMHHLVESIFRRRNDPAQAADARANLVRILDATVAKFGAVKPQVKLLLENGKKAEAAELEEAKKSKASQGRRARHRRRRRRNRRRLEKKDTARRRPRTRRTRTRKTKDAKDAKDAKAPAEEDASSTALVGYGGVETPHGGAQEPRGHQSAGQDPGDRHEDAPLVHHQLPRRRAAGAGAGAGAGAQTQGSFREGELRRASGFVATGVCLALYQGSECAEMCTHFGEALAVLDPRSFLDIICLRLDALLGGGEPYELAPMVQLPHILLQSPALGRSFADALATHLVRDRLHALSDPQSPQSQLVLKLFSLLMHAVSKYSSCEAVLSPHVVPLVEACLKAMKEAEDPSAYVRLLRYLFRALAQAKFDLLYREVVPVLQPTLDALLALLHGPETHELDTVVELCLTLPARLSSILPHLPRLAQPLLRALKSSSSELQLLGLRTLGEFWVDSLNPDFLDPCIAEVESDLMLALWALLKPHQSGAPFGAKALQMLGKLGGRSAVSCRSRSSSRPSPTPSTACV